MNMKSFMQTQCYLIKVSNEDPSKWISEHAKDYRKLFGEGGKFCNLDLLETKERLEEVENILYNYQQISKEG